jgi:hypothetical protein
VNKKLLLIKPSDQSANSYRILGKLPTDTDKMANTTPHPKRSLRSNSNLPTKKSRQGIFKEILDECKSNDIRQLELVYEGVDPADGQVIAASLTARSSVVRHGIRIAAYGSMFGIWTNFWTMWIFVIQSNYITACWRSFAPCMERCDRV